jgi:hypothetical protein
VVRSCNSHPNNLLQPLIVGHTSSENYQVWSWGNWSGVLIFSVVRFFASSDRERTNKCPSSLALVSTSLAFSVRCFSLSPVFPCALSLPLSDPGGSDVA